MMTLPILGLFDANKFKKNIFQKANMKEEYDKE